MFSIPLIFALTFASRMESGLISIPIKRLFEIAFAMASPIIPEPQYKSAQKLNRQFSAIEHINIKQLFKAEVLTCLNASEEKSHVKSENPVVYNRCSCVSADEIYSVISAFFREILQKSPRNSFFFGSGTFLPVYIDTVISPTELSLICISDGANIPISEICSFT